MTEYNKAILKRLKHRFRYMIDKYPLNKDNKYMIYMELYDTICDLDLKNRSFSL